VPTWGAVLRAITLPEVGGDTIWVDAAAAYDGLSSELKERLEGLHVTHDYRSSLQKVGHDYPIVAHPVVRTHRETGRKTLWVNYTQRPYIIGVDLAESRQILSQILEAYKNPQYQVRFSWRPGSVAFWDNRAAVHYAVRNYGDFPRIGRDCRASMRSLARPRAHFDAFLACLVDGLESCMMDTHKPPCRAAPDGRRGGSVTSEPKELGSHSTTPADEPARRLSANDFAPEVLSLFDRYVHGALDRRGFLEQAARFTLAGVSATALLDALSPRFAEAQKVPEHDPRLHTEYVELPSPNGYGKLRAYRVRPKKPAGRLPAVLVIHENRGLNPHIEDVARRFALEGFVALAPDALFPLGGYPGDEDKARELFQKLDQTKTREDFVSAAEQLLHAPDINGKLGAVGFCYGGGITNLLATRLPQLSAAVPFYGSAPPLELVPQIKAALLVQLAENDPRITDAWPAYEAALKAAHIPYEAFIYKGAQHGFHNDTTPRFDEAAAKLAWDRTVALFKRTLSKGPHHQSTAH
jgi:carboxymethylenebutenolidase